MAQPSEGQRKQARLQELTKLESQITRCNPIYWDVFSQDYVLQLLAILKKG